ncbi:hypothetical protein TIFTF001_042701 [Ficus carica]|uniref:Uncharacterized protein n=1 Tax=Ficus carica TaxID=3494 RepID=A0AA87ZIT8_FICCA|nr:hypothetical protein TIFTF001_042701 [Ficus carica]
MVSSWNNEGERFEIPKNKGALLSSSSHGFGCFLTSCCVMWYQSIGYPQMAAAGDRRGRPFDEDRGLLADEDWEFYQVRRETRFDIPSRVSVGSAMVMVRLRPRRQLEAGDVPTEPLFNEPRAEDVVDFRVGVPNRAQRRTMWENQRSIAGDVLPWVKSSNQQRATKESPRADFGVFHQDDSRVDPSTTPGGFGNGVKEAFVSDDQIIIPPTSFGSIWAKDNLKEQELKTEGKDSSVSICWCNLNLICNTRTFCKNYWSLSLGLHIMSLASMTSFVVKIKIPHGLSCHHETTTNQE